VTISTVDEFKTLQPQENPAYMSQLNREFLKPGGRLVYAATTKGYLPLTYMNDFWLMSKDTLEVRPDEKEQMPLHLEYDYVNARKLWFLHAMGQSFQQQVAFGTMEEKDLDQMKEVFLESNPYYLGLTFTVSLVHSLFDFLAFKSDIGFWKQNKSMEGLSAGSMVINTVMQVVIFLYLMDNDTSTIILFSTGIGLLIECWKLTKVFLVSLEPNPGGLLPYKLKWEDRESYVKSHTKDYDRQAMRYLSWVMFPLLVGYAVYDLLYGESHTSWYSWTLSTLVGAVYLFGFILMCPQLYLNYRLKSVAHLPWRQMTFKFLNTIIDDLFAFVIKMPTLHRLAVFRDDLIFLVFLYQRWIYPVDKTRVNEFGYAEVENKERDAVDGPGKEGPGGGGEKKPAAGAPGPSGEGSSSPEVEPLLAGGGDEGKEDSGGEGAVEDDGEAKKDR